MVDGGVCGRGDVTDAAKSGPADSTVIADFHTSEPGAGVPLPGAVGIFPDFPLSFFARRAIVHQPLGMDPLAMKVTDGSYCVRVGLRLMGRP